MSRLPVSSVFPLSSKAELLQRHASSGRITVAKQYGLVFLSRETGKTKQWANTLPVELTKVENHRIKGLAVLLACRRKLPDRTSVPRTSFCRPQFVG